MNIPMTSAALLMALTTGVHVFAGGPDVHEPIQASALNDGLRAISAVIWHTVTVILAVFTIALFWLTRYRNAALVWVVSAVQVGFAVLFIYYGLTRLGSLLPMPQWVIFLAIPALTFWGDRVQGRGR